jgi:hypothetical protein
LKKKRRTTERRLPNVALLQLAEDSAGSLEQSAEANTSELPEVVQQQSSRAARQQ